MAITTGVLMVGAMAWVFARRVEDICLISTPLRGDRLLPRDDGRSKFSG
jgi:hypothetical protein